MVSTWFHNKELNFALGLSVAVSSIGCVGNAVGTPWLYDVGNGMIFI